MHVIAPGTSVAKQIERDPETRNLLVHRAGGSALFGWPGAVANVKTNPLLLAHAGPFAVAVRRQLDAVGHVDRVIGHWIVPAGVPLLWDHPAPLEVVAHGADVRLLCALPRPLRCALVEALLERAARFRFVASTLLQTLGRNLPSGIEARLVSASYVEPAAIELPDVSTRARELRASTYVQTGGFVVAVGRLIELKRFELAIRSAASANVPIVIVGDGPLRTQLEDVARETRARATFTGLLSRKETLAWIAASRALVHPSRTEAAPTVVREARALGVPVIATSSGDIAVWARADLGIVVVDPSSEALAQALGALGVGSRTSNETSAHPELF